MAPSRQHTLSQLRVLQEAVASAVHELSQPLNVVNLLADNALDDVAALEAAGADPAVLGGLRRRVEAIIEQSGKASDITRWVRAFAIGIGAEPTPFDPDALIERVAGIFANDLQVAGIELMASSTPRRHLAVGDEALVCFALAETVLWLSNLPARPMPGPAVGSDIDTPRRSIRLLCDAEPDRGTIQVMIQAHVPDAAIPSTGDGAIPAALPLLRLAGHAPGCRAGMSTAEDGSLHIRVLLPSAR